VYERSRLLRALLKAGDASFMLKYALRVRQQVTDPTLLAGFFGTADVLVPVPGCAPTMTGGLWAANRLAVALVNEGLEALRGRACAVFAPCLSPRRPCPVNGQPPTCTTSRS
jgi:hypothetical protein